MADTENLMALVAPAPDFSKLPVTFHVGPPPLFGAMLILAGIVLPIFIGGILGLIGLVAKGLPASWGMIVLIFAAIPLLALPWGWWVLRTKTVVTVGPEMVSLNKTTPFGRTEWEKPLSEYSILKYRKIKSIGRRSQNKSTHAAMLVHETEEFSVRLINSTDIAIARAALTRMAALLKMEVDQF